MSNRSDTPLAAWQAFAEACHSADEAAAEAASTPDGWRRRGDSAMTVFGQVQQGFALSHLSEPMVQGDRAVIRCQVASLTAPDRKRRLFALLALQEGAWAVSAAVPSERHAALFLRGDMPAVFHPSELPEHPQLAAWAAAQAAGAAQAELLQVAAIEAVSGAPTLGALPVWTENGADAFDALPADDAIVLATGQLAEAFLALPPAVALAATGALQGAGPAVAHLAQVLAGMGQSVLLIDLDLQHPSLHIVFGMIDAGPGLTEWLTRSCAEADALHAVRESLDLLPVGRGDKLDGVAFQRFIAWLATVRERYDRVLVLCPPQGLAPLVAAGAFAPALIVQPGSATTADVRRVADPLRAAGNPLAGVIATRITPESLPLDLPASLAGTAEGRRRHIEVLGAPSLPKWHRAMVGLRITYEGDAVGVDQWSVYMVDGDHLKPVTDGADPSADLLLKDLDVALPDGQAALPDAGEQLTKGLSAAIQGLLGGLSGTRSTQDVERADQLPGALAELIANALEQAGSTVEAAALREQVKDIAPAARAAMPEIPENAGRIPDVLRSRFHTYAAQHITEPEKLVVDADFLQDHGPALAADMVQAVATEIFNEPLNLDLGQGSKIKLDLGSIFRSLTAPKADPDPKADQ